MRSRFIILLTVLLSLCFVGQALATTIAVAPTKVPKGAFVNGGGVNANDNFFWQSVTVTLGTDHADAGVMVLHLPDGMNVADTDADLLYSDEISTANTDTENTGILKYLATDNGATDIVFAYSANSVTAFTDGDEVFNIMFPIETEIAPTLSSDDYLVTFGHADYKIQNIGFGATVASPGDFVAGNYVVESGDLAKGVIVKFGTVNAFDYIRVIFEDTVLNLFADNATIGVIDSIDDAYADKIGTEDITTEQDLGGLTDQVITYDVSAIGTVLVGDFIYSSAVGAAGAAAGYQADMDASLINAIAKVTVVANTTNVTAVYSGIAPVITDVFAETAAASADPFYNVATPAPTIDTIVTVAADYTGDELTTSTGVVTYYDFNDPNDLGLVTFQANMLADNDSTDTTGETYPPSTAANLYAVLPDYVINPNGVAVWEGENFAGTTTVNTTYLFDLDDTAADPGNDTKYYLWASKDNSLTEIDATRVGVTQLLDTAGDAFSDDEAGTGNKFIDMTNLSEGMWYVYITSPLTGRHPLARSGGITVMHHPDMELVAWDADGGGYIENTIADDIDVTLDSGRYYQYDGQLVEANDWASQLELYLRVKDYDDNASVKVFFSSDATLDINDIVTTGTAPNLTIVGLTGATAVVDTTLMENDADEQGYLTLLWDIDPLVFGSTIPARSYTVYAVATDGTNNGILASEGADADADVVAIKHSPGMTLDALSEYETTTGGTYDIDVSQIDTIMLSWGKTGVNGDLDTDDNALISFYIDLDNDSNSTSDYGATGAALLLAAVDGVNTLEIVTGLSESDDSQAGSYYEWNLKEFFAANSWTPIHNDEYHIYAVIDENKPSGVKRVVSIGDGGFLNLADTITEISFILDSVEAPFVKLQDPPAEGVTVNAEETYRMRFNAFDWDDNADIGIFLVKTETAGGVPILVDGEWGANKTIIGANLNGNASLNNKGGVRNLVDGQAYLLNSSDGDLANATWLTENTATYYDATIEPPGVATTYTADINAAAVNLGDGEYWVYIGMDDGSYYTQEVTVGANAASEWQLGDYIVESPSGAVGIVTAIAAPVLTVSLQGDVEFLQAGVQNVDRGTVYSVAYDVTVTAAASVLAPDFTNALVPLYRAPGTLTLVNTASTPPQRNMAITPTNITVSKSDTATVSINVADIGGDVDRIDAYIAVEKAYWTLVDGTTPFDPVTAFSSFFNVNEVIDDAANGRWILRAMVFDNGSTFETANSTNIADTGVGTSIATFQLVSVGTTDAIEEATSIYFVNEPANGWVSKFSNDGNNISVSTLQSTVTIQPKGIIEGIVELEGRANMAHTMTFELRERGSYVSTSEVDFNSNDTDAGTDGVQYTLDSEGKFTLTTLPTGEWDLVVKYDRYLSALSQVNIYPGLDTLFVSFGTLLGGDCFGWTDALGNVYPDNAVDGDDVDRVNTAFQATSADAEWADGTNNWKWADVNEDGVVEEDDLSIVTKNSGNNGAQPFFKPSVTPAMSNSNAMVDLLGVPSELSAGVTYTFQVVAHNTAGVRAYFVDMNYDASMLSFAGIDKGDFLSTDTYSFPVVGESTVGIVNSAFGNNIYSGDGILAEVTFTALVDGTFDEAMLGIHRASLVNNNHVKEFIILEDVPTGITENNLPGTFELFENFPNPFNPTTTISFNIPNNDNVRLDIYDILGRNVRTLVDGAYAAGNYSVVWDAKDMSGNMVSAGVYFYTIKAGDFNSTKRMLFLK